MRAVVVYYSMSGNTAWAAKKIAENLKADLLRIEPKKEYPSQGFKKFLWGGKSAIMGEIPELEEYTFLADNYDLVILGTPVWAGTFTPPLRTFVQEQKENIKDKKLAIYSCYSGSGAQKTIERLRQWAGIDSLEAELALIDPKDKPDAEKEKAVEEFCNKIKKGNSIE